MLVPKEPMQNHTEEEIKDVLEYIVKSVRLTPQELVQVGTEEQIVYRPGPLSQFQIMDDCTEEQIVDMPAAQCQEDIVEVIIVVPKKNASCKVYRSWPRPSWTCAFHSARKTRWR